MRAIGYVLACMLAIVVAWGCGSARGEWPLVWDFDARQDDAVSAEVGADGDLWVLSRSRVQSGSSTHAVLLRIDAQGNLLWATAEPALLSPVAMAVRPDGVALVLGLAQGNLRVTAFGAEGNILWSRTRNGLTSATDFLFGPRPRPMWDGAEAAWRIPSGVGNAFAVLSYSAEGEPRPDRLWLPPTGLGSATSVMSRVDGGLLITGKVIDLVGPSAPPRWWTVALDPEGIELWRHVEDGGTHGSAFSGSFLLSADPVRIWADDETDGGVDSLLLWSLDAASGSPLWLARWPAPGMPINNDTFKPETLAIVDDRILASGIGRLGNTAINLDAVVLSFDPVDGSLVWMRSLIGETHALATASSAITGSTMLATSLFRQANPGPIRLWTAAWNHDGAECALPIEILPSRVTTSLSLANGSRIVVGSASGDIVVQSVVDACSVIFENGFDGNATQ